MSRRLLPPEIIDPIIDLLHDDTEALKQCCLVSKSWIPRSRRHLFAHVQFLRNRLKLWKATFPDPTNSPAYHTRTLTVYLSVEGVEEGDWILPFSRVQRLLLTVRRNEEATSFVPLHKLSSSLKSLHVYFYIPHPDAFNLIRSLSLLEDLTLSNYSITFKSDGPLAPAPPLASPPLTGSLGIFLKHWGTETIHRLLDLPDSLHFREIRLFLYKATDLPPTGKLVTACSGTLEHLHISFAAGLESESGPIDLSQATKLKEVTFQCRSLRIGWIIALLKTIPPTCTHQNLKRISICIHPLFGCAFSVQQIEAAPGMRWSDLDDLLVKLWESYPIRVRIVYPLFQTVDSVRRVKGWVPYLFPELKKRGVIDLVELGTSL